MGKEDEILYSSIGPAGRQSRRSFTRAEVAAGRRQGLIANRHGQPDGPLFWATGDHYPHAVRQALDDCQLLLAAIEREWDKEGAVPTDSEEAQDGR